MQYNFKGWSIGNKHFFALEKVTSNPNGSTPCLLHEHRAYDVVFGIAYVDKLSARSEFRGGDMIETARGVDFRKRWHVIAKTEEYLKVFSELVFVQLR